MAVFEIDEAAVRHLGPRLHPRVIVVTNLARDQLDRYGELVTTAGHVAVAVAASEIAVLAADDPMVAALGAGQDRVAWFGAVPELRAAMPDDRALHGGGAPGSPPVADALLTRAAPAGDGLAIEVRVDGRVVTASLQVPGIYNGYNAAAALLAVARLGIDPVEAARALGGMVPAFGRGQVVDYRGRRVKVILVKNPAGLNQAIRLVGDDSVPRAVLVAINDEVADGRDVSWLWDAEVDRWAKTPHTFGAGGVRAADMALRFKYAGIEAWCEPDGRTALDRLVDSTVPGDTVYLVPTYTAMLAFLEILLPGRPRTEVWS
jgi:UDP-N-acetylmuramyl tripeptide synthase